MSMKRAARRRLFRVLLGCGILLLAGLLYARFVRVTGRGIACVFHQLTGLDCPACGVSRMCMALLRLDFAAAFRYNAVFLCFSPLCLTVAVRQAWLYVQRGTCRLSRAEIVILSAFVLALPVFGVWRNL